MSSQSFKARAEIAEKQKAKPVKPIILEMYHVALFRPEGVSVSEMDALIKSAIIDYACGAGTPKNNLKQITQHPVKVHREPELPYRKTAILHD